MPPEELTKPARYDYTSSQRANRALERLAARQGKRLPIDLDGTHLTMLDQLKEANFGKTAAEMIRRAIKEAHETHVAKVEPEKDAGTP